MLLDDFTCCSAGGSGAGWSTLTFSPSKAELNYWYVEIPAGESKSRCADVSELRSVAVVHNAVLDVEMNSVKVGEDCLVVEMSHFRLSGA